MNYVAINNNNEIVSQILVFNEANVSHAFEGIPDIQCVLAYASDEQLTGSRLRYQDGVVVEYAVITTKRTEDVERNFYWEKYRFLPELPTSQELCVQIYKNQQHLYGGGSEATVPYPMPEIQKVDLPTTTVDKILKTYRPTKTLSL